ncbi:MAG: hypothetical protein V9E93_00585 [Steroidobacteraceae bacterium]
MQAIRPAAARHRAPRELVDDDDLAVADDVLDVLAVQRVRTQRGIQVMHQPDVGRVVEALAFLQQSSLQEQFFDVLMALVGEMNLLRLFVGPVVALAFLRLLLRETRHQLVDLHVELGALLGGARDDQRRARFVDEDRVHLVDHRERELALHAVFDAECQVVAQVVEAEFVVGAVRDVGTVGRALLVRHQAGLDHADAHAEEVIDRRHPVGVALREVFVDRDDVRALAGQRVQVGRQRRDERLAFAGAHFGDLAVVQHHAADQLHVEVAQSEGAARGLADDRERFGQEVVEGLAGRKLLAELDGPGGKVGVGKGLQGGLERVDLPDEAVVLTDESLVATAENAGEPISHWGSGR